MENQTAEVCTMSANRFINLNQHLTLVDNFKDRWLWRYTTTITISLQNLMMGTVATNIGFKRAGYSLTVISLRTFIATFCYSVMSTVMSTEMLELLEGWVIGRNCYSYMFSIIIYLDRYVPSSDCTCEVHSGGQAHVGQGQLTGGAWGVWRSRK